jgi:LmbE family N-acetylglucosaminyl deacetylase
VGYSVSRVSESGSAAGVRFPPSTNKDFLERKIVSSGLSNPSASFNPAQHGTPEASWEAALRDAPLLSLPSSAILVVSPHPDDEVLGAGGLIRCAAHAGHEVAVLSVTDGEAAYPDWKELNRIRRREVRDALSVLVPQTVTTRHLGIPDGKVDANRALLSDAIDRRLSRCTTLIAPYERDGHPDHDATGEVCCELARLRKVTLWRYPIWIWHHGSPGRFAGRPLGRFMLDAVTRAAKARALSCFTSQMRPLGREPIVPTHVLEYFARPYEVFLHEPF